MKKLYQVLGDGYGCEKLIFHCYAANLEDARDAFEMAAQQQFPSLIIWDHSYSDYNGDVDGRKQPISVLLPPETPVPWNGDIPKRAYYLSVTEVELGQIEYFC